MKSKIKISLFVLLIISVIGVNVLYKNKKPKPKSNLAIMIDENGNGSYTSASSVPKGSYTLNEEKTVCENGGKVASYNNLTGQIGFSFLGSDRCSLYFEKVSSPTISNVSLSGSTLSASFNSKKNLCCYAITTSTSEPSDWTNISGSSYELNTSIVTPGTYYLWLKDSYGNVTKYDNSIIVSRKGYETILINNGNGATTVDAAKSYIESKGTPSFSNLSLTNEGMYAAKDDLGTSYYFRGAVNNNWVNFGKENGKDIYWRIIRINGDGSIRMIYSGTTAPTSSTAIVMAGTGTQINVGIYNSDVDSSEYVGFMHTLGSQHGNSISSSIKTTIDNWYKTTTLESDTTTKNLVVDQIFCNDRSVTSGTWSTSSTVYYADFTRLYSNKSPILTCPTAEDKFTVNGSIGNGTLTYPVGLITADEVSMAGAIQGTVNNSFYLKTGQGFFTGSPYDYSKYFSKGTIWYVTDSGSLNGSDLDTSNGIRPVISLSSEVKLYGDGTWNNPYVAT